jgi:hypothetical protein
MSKKTDTLAKKAIENFLVEEKKKITKSKKTDSSKMSVAYRIGFFTEKVFQYQKEFGLFNWEINVEEVDDPDCRGEIQYDNAARLAVVYYDTTWINQKDLNRDEITLVALHEVCELFLSEIHMFIIKHANEELANSMTHSVIRFFEYIFLKKQ